MHNQDSISSNATVRLKPGREKPVLQGHPWIFSGAIAEIKGKGAAGTVVNVISYEGEWLARGLMHPTASLAVRLFTRDQAQAIDAEYLGSLIDKAITMRQKLVMPQLKGMTDSLRLVFSESDGLSGLVVDQFADTLVVQVSAAAWVPFLPDAIACLKKATGLERVHIMVDKDATIMESLEQSQFANLSSANVTPTKIKENGFVYEIDFSAIQKTGFYLDQRVNRQRVAAFAAGRRVLSAYCYTGAFEVHAAAAGACAVTGIDSSEPAINQAKRHHLLNSSPIEVNYLRANVADALRQYRDSGTSFDLIILDPPKFVSSRDQKERGLRAYKDINLLAMKLLSPGGVLATFSCSGQVTMMEFKTMIGWASIDARRNVRIIEQLSQPADHPILSIFPESEYLKGLLCYVQ